MEITSELLDKQIAEIKGRLGKVSMKVFGYGDDLMRKLDPEISTIRPNMLAIYEIAPTHPQRLSVFLDTVSKVIGDDVDVFEEESVSEEQIHKLMVLDVLVKCGIPLIKKTSDEDFAQIIGSFKEDVLPKSLTSTAEIERLKRQMTRDLDVTTTLQGAGINDVGGVGNDFASSVSAVEQLKSGLERGVPITEIFEKISKLD